MAFAPGPVWTGSPHRFVAMANVFVALEPQFQTQADAMRNKYLGSTTCPLKPWASDNPSLADAMMDELETKLNNAAPSGTTFKQDPGDPTTWGFYS